MRRSEVRRRCLHEIYSGICVFAEEHLRELTGGHGLLRTQESGDREPVRGALGGCGRRPVLEGMKHIFIYIAQPPTYHYGVVLKRRVCVFVFSLSSRGKAVTG